MIKRFDSGDVYVTVISKGRPGNVEQMQNIVGPATWFVPGDEADEYLNMGAARAVDDRGSLCAARNTALDVAHDVPCVQLSDDLRGIGRLGTDGKAHPIEFGQAVEALMDASYAMGARLAGGTPTGNAFYASTSVSSNLFILGDFMLIHPCPLRFDEQLRLKEDYDYTCQHFNAYGAVARVGYIIPNFQHRTNAGGAVAVRTPELEQETILYLKSKWGQWIKDNPKRPNEILLRLPRPRRSL